MLHSRDKRVGEAVRHALSHLFSEEMADPRLPSLVTITQVKMSKDLRHATVFYSQLPDDDEALESMEELLEDSKNYLRSRVAEEINIKFAPDLSFRFDPSEQNYQRVNAALQRIRRKDEKKDSE